MFKPELSATAPADTERRHSRDGNWLDEISFLLPEKIKREVSPETFQLLAENEQLRGVFQRDLKLSLEQISLEFVSRENLIKKIKPDATAAELLRLGQFDETDEEDSGLLDRRQQLFTKALENSLKNIEAMSKAMVDSLTGLLSRDALMSELDREIKIFTKREKEHNNFVIIYLDGDHFKDINTAFDHDGGDTIIKAMGQAIKDGIREYDFAGRYGGDEFVVVFPGVNLTDEHGQPLKNEESQPLTPETIIKSFQQRIQKEIQKVNILKTVEPILRAKLTGEKLEEKLKTAKQMGNLDATFGATSSFNRQENNLAAEKLINEADTAMGQAKASEAGRGSLVIAENI